MEQPDPLIVPGAFNALTALMIERAGFEAVYATGAGIANAFLGVPDLGLLSMPEMVQHVRAMHAVTSVPLLVDIDTGYGGVHNVERAVRELEVAGAAAVQLEDQVFPKRCGHFDQKALVPTEEMVAKVLAATESRTQGLVVIARTDAVAVEGYDAAVRRARAYRAAGADVIFVEALETEEHIRSLARDIDAPKLINMVEGGLTPFMPVDTLGALGYSIIAFANFALRTAMKALAENLEALRRDGSSERLVDSIIPWDTRQAIVGLGEFDSRRDQWASRAAHITAEINRAPKVP